MFYRLSSGLRMFFGIIVAVIVEKQHLHRVSGSSQMEEATVGSEVDFAHVSSTKLKLLITVCGPKEELFQICRKDSRNFMILLKVI